MEANHINHSLLALLLTEFMGFQFSRKLEKVAELGITIRWKW